jgi:hypothetical protein
MLLFSPVGVTPKENIDIRTIAVAQPREPQVFEITETHLAERQESLRNFLKWIKAAESHQAARLPPSDANGCSSLSVAGNAPSARGEFSKGLVPPTGISAVPPNFHPTLQSRAQYRWTSWSILTEASEQR